jgi:hypothetical protein
MKRAHMLVLLPGLLLSIGCRGFTEVETDFELIGIEWEMRFFEQSSGALVPVGANAITLEFLEDGSLEGRGYAPEWPWWPGFGYRSTYEEGPDHSIAIERPVYTRPPAFGLTPHPSRWPEYWLALSAATEYESDGNSLTIFYNENEALHFTAVAAE